MDLNKLLDPDVAKLMTVKTLDTKIQKIYKIQIPVEYFIHGHSHYEIIECDIEYSGLEKISDSIDIFTNDNIIEQIKQKLNIFFKSKYREDRV